MNCFSYVQIMKISPSQRLLEMFKKIGSNNYFVISCGSIWKCLIILHYKKYHTMFCFFTVLNDKQTFLHISFRQRHFHETPQVLNILEPNSY